jgi:hypothetical protein
MAVERVRRGSMTSGTRWMIAAAVARWDEAPFDSRRCRTRNVKRLE